MSSKRRKKRDIERELHQNRGWDITDIDMNNVPNRKKLTPEQSANFKPMKKDQGKKPANLTEKGSNENDYIYDDDISLEAINIEELNSLDDIDISLESLALDLKNTKKTTNQLKNNHKIEEEKPKNFSNEIKPEANQKPIKKAVPEPEKKDIPEKIIPKKSPVQQETWTFISETDRKKTDEEIENEKKKTKEQQNIENLTKLKGIDISDIAEDKVITINPNEEHKNESNIKSKKRKKKKSRSKIAAPLGCFIIILCVIGIATIGYFSYLGISVLTDNEADKRQFDKYLAPIVMSNPETFKNVSDVDLIELTKICINTVSYENTVSTSYQFDSIGRLIVPFEVVQNKCNELFGNKVIIEKADITYEEDLIVEYNADTNSFLLPLIHSSRIYLPYTEEIKIKGDIYTLTVGYVNGTTQWVVEGTDGKQKTIPSSIEKYMTYTLRRVDNNFNILSIEVSSKIPKNNPADSLTSPEGFEPESNNPQSEPESEVESYTTPSMFEDSGENLSSNIESSSEDEDSESSEDSIMASRITPETESSE